MMVWFTACLTVILVAGTAVAKSPLPDDVFKEKTILQVMRDLIDGKEELAVRTLSDVAVRAGLYETPAEAKRRSRSLVADFMRNDEDNFPECDVCVRLFGFLKGLNESVWDYDRLADTVTDLCIELLPHLIEGLRVVPFCNGTIAHQGPHLYAAVMGSESVDFCQFINTCNPPQRHKDISDIDEFLRWNEVLPKSKAGRYDQRKFHVVSKPRDVDYKSAVKVVQLADIHVEPDYAVGSPTDCGLNVCCQEKWDDGVSTGEAGKWGDYQCNIPERTMKLFLRQVKMFDPSFVIYSGDSPPHSMWEETMESQLLSTEILVKNIEEILSNFTIYNNLGNHEMYPTNIYYRNLSYTVIMSVAFVDLWRPLSDIVEEEWDRFRDGGYYSAEAAPGLRIISFNTNFMYTFNWYNVFNWDSVLQMMEFMKTELMQAKENGDKVILIGHHPPGNPDFIISASREFNDLVLEFSDVIVLHVSGHTHTDQFRLVIDEDGEAQHVVHVAPSISTGNTKNPSMRIFYLDPNTFDLLDYDHYYFDLKEADNFTDPEIVRLYRAKDEYNMTDLSAESYRDLADRMENDQALLNKHHHNRNARADGEDSEECVDDAETMCRTEYLCRCRTASYDDYRRCLSVPTTTTTTTTTTTAPIDGGITMSGSIALVLTAITFVAIL